jgi:2-methylcitrate dehydratase PrpD
MAALLAQQHFVATREFLTAKDGGLYNAYADGGLPDAAVADLGARWELEQIAMRLWPSASLIQGMATALFDILDRHPVEFAKVRKVRVGLSPGAYKMHGGFGSYKGKFEALLSVHYTAAVLLRDRALTLAQFEPDRYEDCELRRFAAERVEAYGSGSVEGSQANVDIEMDGGAVLSERCKHPLGSFENPLSRHRIAEKFRTYAQGVLPEADIARIIGAVEHLEDFGAIGGLMDMLRAAPRTLAAAE